MTRKSYSKLTEKEKIRRLVNFGLSSRVYSLTYQEDKMNVTDISRKIYGIKDTEDPPRCKVIKAIKQLQELGLLNKPKFRERGLVDRNYSAKINGLTVQALFPGIDKDLAFFLSKIFETNSFRKASNNIMNNLNKRYSIRGCKNLSIVPAILDCTDMYTEEALDSLNPFKNRKKVILSKEKILGISIINPYDKKRVYASTKEDKNRLREGINRYNRYRTEITKGAFKRIIPKIERETEEDKYLENVIIMFGLLPKKIIIKLKKFLLEANIICNHKNLIKFQSVLDFIKKSKIPYLTNFNFS